MDATPSRRSLLAAAGAAAGAALLPGAAALGQVHLGNLQIAIDWAVKNKKPLHLPDGIYIVRNTLKINAAVGLRIEGVGGLNARPDWELGGWKETTTRTLLLWAGPPGGTMIEMDWSLGCTFANLGLCGIASANNPVRAGKLIHCRSKPGWANALHHFENCLFSHAAVGVQMGSGDKDNTCSDVSMRRVHFSHCDTGFRTVNNQAVNFYFDNVGGGGKVDALVHFHRGGDLRWRGGAGTLTGAPTILRIDGGGDNAATFALEGFRFEFDHDWPVIVDAAGNGGTTSISVADLSDATSNATLEQNPTPGCFRIGPGVGLTARNCVFQRPVARLIGSANRPATLTLDNCVLPTQKATDSLTADPNSFWRAAGCRAIFTNRPLPPEGNWPGTEGHG